MLAIWKLTEMVWDVLPMLKILWGQSVVSNSVPFLLILQGLINWKTGSLIWPETKIEVGSFCLPVLVRLVRMPPKRSQAEQRNCQRTKDQFAAYRSSILTIYNRREGGWAVQESGLSANVLTLVSDLHHSLDIGI